MCTSPKHTPEWKAHGVEGIGPRELRSDGIIGMSSDRTHRIFLVHRKGQIGLSSRKKLRDQHSSVSCSAMETSGIEMDPN